LKSVHYNNKGEKMGHKSALTEELEQMDCETMTIKYEKCGVLKKYTGPKAEIISLLKKIQADRETMKLIEILHPRKAAT